MATITLPSIAPVQRVQCSREIPSQAEQKKLRHTLGAFATGVTVVTALARNGEPLGVTVNSFASVSLDPPLVLWSQVKSAPSYPEFLAAKTIVINILSAQQRHLSLQFSRPLSYKFDGVEYGSAPCGAPILDGCAATFICRIVDHYYGGDHTIHLCRIESFKNHDRHPLIFCKGTYIEQQSQEHITQQ